MNAEAADLPLVQRASDVGRRDLQRIEGLSLVLDFDSNHPGLEREADCNELIAVTSEPVADHVRDDFLHRQAHIEHHLRRHMMGADELGQRGSYVRQLREVVLHVNACDVASMALGSSASQVSQRHHARGFLRRADL
jgi:hypothetical protein